jgi:protein subunit release factor B
MSKRKTQKLQKKLEAIQYLLETTPEQRKAEKQARKAQRRIKRLHKLRSFKPFDLKCVRWYEKRQVDIMNGKAADDGIIGGEVSPA